MKKFLILLVSLCALTASAQKKIVHPQAKPRTTSPAKTKPAKPNPQHKSHPVCVSYDASTNCIVFGNNSYKMVYVSGGSFNMGATSEQTEPYDNEKPVHSVTLSSYMIGETEVTQALWQAVMGNNPSEFKGTSNPVESVSWFECQKFLSKLNSLTGQSFRLPTEAEWEFAARGGNKSNSMEYSGAYSLGNCGWYEGNSGSKTHPVATKQANELGIYDMSGNVREYCQDWYGSYSNSAQTNPQGPSSGLYRVYRGGCWNYNAGRCRSAYRYSCDATNRANNLGLRLAL